jgi:nucleotide-binding universal stress UspA family protein
MFRTVLVPLDGSVFGEQAVPFAVALSNRSGATLRLLRVVPPLADYFFMPPELNSPLDGELRQQHREDAQAYLESVAHRLKGAGRVVCDVVEEEEGVCESICADVVKTGADLIVLSSHGRGAVARLWLGSIADKLVRSAPVPVLLARPPEHPPAADLQRSASLKHILVALGGTTLADRVVEPALAIGSLTGAEYTLVRVVRPPFPSSSEYSGAGIGPSPASGWSGLRKVDQHLCEKAENYLRTVADRLRAGGAKVQTRVHIAEQPAAAVLREAVLSGADLIALETHGRGASRLLIGSVADKVVRGSSLPVLICRLPHQGAK